MWFKGNYYFNYLAIDYFPITACNRKILKCWHNYFLESFCFSQILSALINPACPSYQTCHIFTISKVESCSYRCLSYLIFPSFLPVYNVRHQRVQGTKKVAANKHTLLNYCLAVFSVFGCKCGLEHLFFIYYLYLKSSWCLPNSHWDMWCVLMMQ